jgi:hypothetical protein
MRKLRMKQGYKYIYMINYRSGGLSAKNCKIQKQYPQIRKSLELDLKRIMGGAGLKKSNGSSGFSTKFARHTKNCRNYKIVRGLNCKGLGNRLPWCLAPTVGRIPGDSGHGRPR